MDYTEAKLRIRKAAATEVTDQSTARQAEAAVRKAEDAVLAHVLKLQYALR